MAYSLDKNMPSITAYAGTMQGWTGVDTSGSSSWTNPNNAKAADGVYATNLIDDTQMMAGGNLTLLLYFHNFAFNVPAGATINGIAIKLYMHSTAPATCTDNKVQLTNATNATTGNNQATSASIPSSDTAFNYGGSTNLMGATLTSTTVNSSAFGFVFKASCTDTVNTQTVSVDYGNMTVYYTGGVVQLTDIMSAACEPVAGIPANFCG